MHFLRRIFSAAASVAAANPVSLLSALVVCAAVGTCAHGQATYRLDLDNTWSTQTHPGLFPDEAHFSWLGGGLHNSEVYFWQEGELASPGMKEMAETGVIDMFVSEVDAMIPHAAAEQSLAYRWWFCPQRDDGRAMWCYVGRV